MFVYALRRLLTTDSRSVELPEIPGLPGMVQLFAQKFDNGSGGYIRRVGNP